ncbi:MAG TPA: hypothetical protein VD710_02575 [Nitrososphaeraceae archaeon]|nr:hypothetical protein [Nitrososphaeraceae archaeon]
MQDKEAARNYFAGSSKETARHWNYSGPSKVDVNEMTMWTCVKCGLVPKYSLVTEYLESHKNENKNNQTEISN